MSDSLRKILEDTREILRFRDEMGLGELPVTQEIQKFLAGEEKSAGDVGVATHNRPAPGVSPRCPISSDRTGPAVAPVSGQPIGEIDHELVNCRLCPLQENRRQVVIGSGSGSCRLMVIEGAPGSAEEADGHLMAGAAGELFDKMLMAIGLQRSQIYLTSLVKCRPPGDREPTAAEIQTCQSYLFRQIAAVNPLVICGLGPLPARILTGSARPLFQLRGRFHDFHGTPLMVTFHPAFLLRNSEMKKASWQDLQLLQKRLAPANC